MNSQVRPFTPADAKRAFETQVIPSTVIDAVNELLAENYSASSIRLTKDQVINRIHELDPKLTRQELIDKNFLDFEGIFREAGWDVEYDSPAYCENYEQHWKFKQKRGR